MTTGRSPLRWAEDGATGLGETAAPLTPRGVPKAIVGAVKSADYSAERQRVLEWLDSFGDPLTVYRGLRVGSPDQVNMRQLGIFWTPVKKEAHSPYGVSKQGVEVVVEAKIRRKDVDVEGTVTTMRRYPSEMEIRLRIGSVVQVVRLHLPEGQPIPLNRPGRTASDGGLRTAVRTKPPYPHATDENIPTNENLWKRVLEVASGRLREYTQGDRTIHAPNDGRGYQHMPNHPKGIAWAVKQYKGFGGAWKPRDEKPVEASTPILRVLAAGGVAVSEGGELDALVRGGLIRLAGEQGTRRYWDITEGGRRVVQAGLKEDLVHKVEELIALGKAHQDATQLSDGDKRAMKEVATWFRKHFRVDSTKTPKGQKRLKEEAMSFLNALDTYSELGGWTSPNVLLHLDEGVWGRTLKRDLDNLVQYFTGEGDTSKGKKEQVVETKLAHATYVNRAATSEANFIKYAEKIDGVFGRIKGWRTKALKGNLTVVFQGASQLKSQGKYVTAKDEMWVKATPAVMKRGEGSYGSPDYIIVHELGHRFEKFNRLPTDFDQNEWYTTRYSQTEGFGASESFAELFALGHFDIKGNWDQAIVERFESVMAGKERL